MGSSILRHGAAIVVGLSAVSLAQAQESSKLSSSPATMKAPAQLVMDSPVAGPVSGTPVAASESSNGDDDDSSGGGFLTSDHGFPNFIGWLSNPTRNIDPRS